MSRCRNRLAPRTPHARQLGFYYTWRQGLDNIFEARLWQAATVDWPDVTGGLRRYVIHHRFMREERFRDNSD